MLVTSDCAGMKLPSTAEDGEEFDQLVLKTVMRDYGDYREKRQYSVVNKEINVCRELTLEKIAELAIGINSSKEKVIMANDYVLQGILMDAYMGRAYECICSSINTDYRLIYPKAEEGDSEEVLKQVKEEIETFNEAVNLKGLIAEGVTGVIREGNYAMYLRLARDEGGVYSAVIDHYPLNVCYPSDYYIGGENLLEFDISALRSKLQKMYKTSRRARKAIYFEKMKEEVRENYPEEVYDGFEGGEAYVRLNADNSGFIKINSMGRQLGVSPFFQALRALVVLNNIEAADVADSKARSKKIIFQKLRKELMGPSGDRKGFPEREYAHSAAAAALQTNFCLYTAPAYVEDLSYVVDKSSNENTSNTIKTYTSKLLAALGIGFADSDLSSYSIAKISVDQLMRTVNSIAKQLERIIHKYYRVYLEAIGLPAELAPKIRILDSQMMEWELRKEFAQFAYSTLNVSRDTVFRIVGLDVDDEVNKRKQEETENLDAVFKPRATGYNTSGDTALEENGRQKTNGRPVSSDNTEKTKFDQQYTKEVRNAEIGRKD